MKKKLNNKGMTVVEILVCFVLIAIITVSMYSTVTAYQNKQHIEASKEKILTFKNLLTKEIQDDFIKKGVVKAEKIDVDSSSSYDTSVKVTFRDGTEKILTIYQKMAHDYGYVDGETRVSGCSNGMNDLFYIKYGDMKYSLPDVGYGLNEEECRVNDLRINEVNITIKERVLSIQVDFSHPELLSRYGIHIVTPLNFT